MRLIRIAACALGALVGLVLAAPDLRALEPGIITAIDAKTGVVTAKETATGRSFRFAVTDAALLRSLGIGQGVYANSWTGKVSVTGFDPCCNITTPASVASLPTDTSPTTTAGPPGGSLPVGPARPPTPGPPSARQPEPAKRATAEQAPAAVGPTGERCVKSSTPSVAISLDSGKVLGTWVDVKSAGPGRCLYVIQRDEGTRWAIDASRVRVEPR